jgi:type VI secretion system protein ImpA
LDIEALLQDISPDAPCGENLAYDPAYSEIERAMAGTPERQVGDALVAAEEPNWRDVKKKCLEILQRTKDLRMVVNLALAAMQTEGLPGLRDGFALICGLLEKHWDSFHPQLDPDDNNDPLERMNIVASLAPESSFQDPLRFPQRLLEVKLCSSPQIGRFSMRDVLLSTGELASAEGEETPNPGHIDAAFASADNEELTRNAAAIVEAEELLDKMNSIIEERVGVANAPDLSKIETPVKQIRQLLQQKAPQAFAGAASGDGEAGEGSSGAEGDGTGSAEGAAAPGQGSRGGVALSGEITSRDDVIRALDKVCAYYKRFEPSSPVPLLVQRARRLVKKEFVEIIQDLTPDAIKQIELIGGAEQED